MDDTSDERSQNALLPRALRDIRKGRRMRAAEVATAMGLPIRTYEQFEAGTGRFTYPRLVAFARATDSDPVAILATLPLRSPESAVHCIDNKMMTIVFAALRDLLDKLGSDLELVEPRALIGAMDGLAKDLEDPLGGAISSPNAGWRRKPERWTVPASAGAQRQNEITDRHLPETNVSRCDQPHKRRRTAMVFHMKPNDATIGCSTFQASAQRVGQKVHCAQPGIFGAVGIGDIGNFAVTE
jgi:transcriptional regulator with XRE-family HTH domain